MTNYILCGIGKVERDFQFFFDEIKIEKYINSNALYPGVIDIYNYEPTLDDYIIICKDYYFYEKLLKEKGLTEKKNFIYVDEYINNYLKATPFIAELLFKTMFDFPYPNFKCNIPFEHVQIDTNGDVRTCCSAYMKLSIGNLYNESFADIWFSKLAKVLRLSVINKTYSFCNFYDCAYTDVKKIEKKAEDIENETYGKYTVEFPKMINIAIDDSCNLKCLCCRKEKINNSMLYTKRRELMDKVLDIVPNIKHIYLAGNGEVFFSKIYMDFLKMVRNVSNNELNIVSNLNNINENVFRELAKKFESVNFYVSIDASRKETYEYLRNGGDFLRLKNNLEMLKTAKHKGLVSRIIFRFVVQLDNYLEMSEFVDFSHEYDANQVDFLHLIDNNTYSRNEYMKKSLLNEAGFVRDEYKNYFKNKVFRNHYVNLDYAFHV